MANATRKAAAPLLLSFGPFIAVRDSFDPSAAQPDRANLLQNCFPGQAENGEGLQGLPGFQVMGAQLGGGMPGQGVVQFTKLNGTEYTVSVVGGKFYTYSWTTTTWTETLTGAQLSAASVTLSTTARVALVPFADRLIVSDGINTPWSWDGTAGGGITLMVNAPVFFGPPTVRSAKLVGIKAADRTTIVWSEEFDETLGYEATVGTVTYSNVWQLGQTDQNRLVAVRGTNSALYYWRERSTGAIYGEIAANFVTTSTHDALSSTVGTRSPYGIVSHNESFLFPDADGRTQRLAPREAITPVWTDFSETLKQIPRANLADALAIDYLPARLLLIGYTEIGQTVPSAWLAYRDTGSDWLPAGIMRGFTASAAAMVKDGNGIPTWVHLSSDGYAYQHGNPDGALWDFGFASGAVAIAHVVQAMPVQPDTEYEVGYRQLDFVTRCDSPLTLSVDYDTPYGSSTPLSLTVTPSGALWDVAQWDVDKWGAGSVEKHTAVGWQGIGRWIRPRWTHATIGQRFSWLRARVTGSPYGTAPTIP